MSTSGTPDCFKGKTVFPQRPNRTRGADDVAWITWDMLQWFANNVFDPFADCANASGGCCSGFTHVGIPIDEAYKIPGAGLIYWYRLGEAAAWTTTVVNQPNAFLDSSGNGYHASMRNQAPTGGPPAVWITNPADEALPTTHVDGAFVGGSAEDGGIRFQMNQYQWTSFEYYLCIASPVSAGFETSFVDGPVGIGTGSTFSCWLGFIPYGTDPGVDDNNILGTSAFRPLMGTHYHSFGIGSWGCRLGFGSDTGLLYYLVDNGNNLSPGGFSWTSDFTFVPNKYYNLVITLEKLTATTYRRRIYLNTHKILEVSGNFATVGPNQGGTNLTMGGANDDDIRFGHGRGMLDEVAMWSTVLSQENINNLFLARVANEGDTWTTDQLVTGLDIPADSITGDLIHGSADATINEVYSSDGAGGTVFAYPNHRFLVGGVDP